jgi:hypothetical protein
MYELPNNQDRLIVILPMSLKHFGRVNCLYVDGTFVAQYKTFAEAARHARALADGFRGDPSDWALES